MLKVENEEILELFLIDFGFAIKLENQLEPVKDYCGTPKYMAPELTKKKYSSLGSIDVWALGVILYRITIGAFPF